MSDASQSTDLTTISASGLMDRFSKKELSPVEATRHALQRIEAFNPIVNAFCHVDPEGALTAARESEQRWQNGKPAGILDGVPISIKDLTPVRAMPVRKGSLTTDAAPAEEDAPFVAHLRAAGAVILGKTTTPEFGWKGVTDSKLTGITRNPWNIAKTPGGSSGGAAAAAALNMGYLHHGTDGGGSIRIPCGFTGTVGIKPTFGWVPQVPPSAMTMLSHMGPIGRSIDDIVRLLKVVSQHDGRDWYANPPGEPVWSADMHSGIAGLKIAFSPDLGYANVDPDIAALVEKAVAKLSELGAHVERADPGFEDPTDLFNTFWHTGAATILAALSDEQKAQMDPGLVDAARSGMTISAKDYLLADTKRAALGAHMHTFHQTYDLLVTPTLAVTAFDVGQNVPDLDAGRAWTDWTPFSYPFNITQQPAASIPCGRAPNGLPVGLQIVGPKFRDDLVLRAGQALMQAMPPEFPDVPIDIQ